MNQTNKHQELEGNRFEALYQRWKGRRRRSKRRILLFAIAALLVLETASIGVVFTWYHYRGINSLPFLEKFVLTRNFVSPFLFENPVKKHTKVRYIGTRERLRSSTKWFAFDPLLGWRPAPNIGQLKQPNRVRDIVGWKMTNAQGFPSAGKYEYFYERPKPPGIFRIIVTGGSAVEGDGAESPLDNLPSRLYFALREQAADILPEGYTRVEVINAGVGGFVSAQEYLYLVTDLTSYEPDLVISYGGAVDLIAARLLYDQEGKVTGKMEIRKSGQVAERMARSYSVFGSLYLFLGNLMNEARFLADEFAITYVVDKSFEKLGNAWAGWTDTATKLGATSVVEEPDEDIYIAAALGMYENSVKLMTAAARIGGFRIAFALEPLMTTSDKVRTQWEEEMYAFLSARELQIRAKFYQRARALLQRLATEYPDRPNTCFIDVSRAFTGVEERVFEDTSHVLGAGNRILARQLIAGLRECGTLPRG